MFGSPSALAKALGVYPSAISMWSDDKPIPNQRYLQIRYELKPELFEQTA